MGNWIANNKESAFDEHQKNNALKYISLISLISWMVDKEKKGMKNIYEAYYKVGSDLLNIFNQKKNLKLYNITYDVKGGTKVLVYFNTIEIIANFLINAKNDVAISRAYLSALREIDLLINTPLKNSSLISNIEITLNYDFYNELDKVIKTFRYTLFKSNDPIKGYLDSLLLRCKNPRLLKADLLKIEQLKEISYEDNYPYGIKLNKSDTSVKELTPSEKSNDYDRLLKENEELKNRIAKLEAKEMQSSNNQNAISSSEISLSNSDLLLLAALVKMLSNEKRAYSQSKILETIEDNHEGIKGLSKSRTEKVLAAANRIYKPLIKNKNK